MRRRGVTMEDVEKSLQRHGMKFFLKKKQAIPDDLLIHLTPKERRVMNIPKEKQEIDLLQKKWGSHIVRIDKNPRSHNLKRKKIVEDYNPVIYVPIRGV
jgi:hypothetical protein